MEEEFKAFPKYCVSKLATIYRNPVTTSSMLVRNDNYSPARQAGYFLRKVFLIFTIGNDR